MSIHLDGQVSLTVSHKEAVESKTDWTICAMQSLRINLVKYLRVIKATATFFPFLPAH